MLTPNPIEVWINNVAISHSNSTGTSAKYKQHFQEFCDFIGKTPQQILDDYEASTDRKFKREYSQLLRTFRSHLVEKRLAPNTIHGAESAVKSFFKYNDLPLGYIPSVRLRVVHHNKDITREEIKLIIDASTVRERAFYAVMAQSGLRPYTICKLKHKQIKEEFEKGIIPCMIDVPEEHAKGKYHSYFTFIGEEAVRYLKAYLNTKPGIQADDYIFTKQGKTNIPASPRSLGSLFLRTVLKLQTKGLMEVEQEKRGKPHTIRLYNLRKWFRKQAGQMGFENVEFLMGHTVKAGQHEHYRPKDKEWYREKYKEIMPNLRIETLTPTESEKRVDDVLEENKELKQKMLELEDTTRKQKEDLKKLKDEFFTLRQAVEAVVGLDELEEKLKSMAVIAIAPTSQTKKRKKQKK